MKTLPIVRQPWMTEAARAIDNLKVALAPLGVEPTLETRYQFNVRTK